MKPRAGSECILQLALGQSLAQRKVWGPGQGTGQVLEQGLWREQQPPIPHIPHKVRWLWERVMGGRGRLRARSRAVLGDSESAESRRWAGGGPSERMAVSLRMTVGRTLHQVSTWPPASGSVCMAVSARPRPGPQLPGSSGPRQTSMQSEGRELQPSAELQGALEANEEALELLSEVGDSCCSTPLLTAGSGEGRGVSAIWPGGVGALLGLQATRGLGGRG